MDSEPVMSKVIVEGYDFYRSDGEPFDSSVMTFMPPFANTGTSIVKPYATTTTPADYTDSEKYTVDDYRHVCTDIERHETFILAHRCEPSWNALSDQQKDVIEMIENEVRACRRDGKFFSSIIMEGPGGCGKTRLMAYVMNHAPDTTHVMYLTKQNKRLQDFLYDEIRRGELITPQAAVDMSKSRAGDFDTLHHDEGGRYACTVEKLVYNASCPKAARQTNSRRALQWKMKIPDVIFGDDLADRAGNAVILLDEYTMISPPLLHKMLHCVRILFDAPTVLIMGGDRFQLGPINWDIDTDKFFRGRYGDDAPAGAITTNNEYYVSDVREELGKRFDREPFEYHMTGSQRCRDDPELAKMVIYLRKSCENKTSVKAIERKLAEFGRARGIRLYRYDANRGGIKTGQLAFPEDVDLDIAGNSRDWDTEDDDDRHLGDDDSRDAIDVEVDWTQHPAIDMLPFINFYRNLYEEIYRRYNDGRLNDDGLPRFVYDKASRFALANYPVFMVKTNDKCNILSDTFLKCLYNGVYTDLREKYANDDKASRIGIRPLLEKLCVSMSMAGQSPVQQTLMTGVPYRVTETIKAGRSPVISNGELVLLTSLGFDKKHAVQYVVLKTLQRDTDHFLSVYPGYTQNRLVETGGERLCDPNSLFSASVNETLAGTNRRRTNDADFSIGATKKMKADEGEQVPGWKIKEESSVQLARPVVIAFMLPLVPMICENIYQMQGNTIVSNCFIDLLSTNQNDIYVAVSRFQKTSSIRGMILSK